MHILTISEEETGPAERRAVERRPATIRGVLRHFSRGAEFIDLNDISTHGCGFSSRWPYEPGARVFLGLPGTGPWLATVAWHEDGQGGLSFDQPLRAAVAQRLAAEPALRSKS
jgi:hypothetical protein